ncbi:lipase family protein [Austwickia chelonae]|uniref:Putative lipase n=1 Tax=Austwickia chelonae NBRC 105200 TaxID=1184607 RepID=K6VU40_9MICO|nr:lipase family protein [Austwickia chelonae]GAB78860.1 putative lipase [Austwickia chelonae NBRC 105200]
MRLARELACLAVSAITLAGTIPPTSAAEIPPAPGTAGAKTVTGTTEQKRPAFYEPPKDVPRTPGRVIRSEYASRQIDPLRVGALSSKANRVLYSSVDRTGAPVAVSGLVVVPTSAWKGPGPRPIVTYAPVTQGMADRCAPSRRAARFMAFEELFYWNLLRDGYAVAMTDYQGLGTPGTHTYMNRISQGRAVLDIARAAISLPGSGLSPDSPVGIVGYSQGGGAAAAAAELASSWAPELKVKGASVGAPPADLGQLANVVDSKQDSMFMMYALTGLMSGYRIDPKKHLSEAGEKMLGRVENSCLGDKYSFAKVSSRTLLKNGKPLAEHFDREPFASILAENRIGKRAPAMPVQINHSRKDETIPFSSGKTLHRQWCQAGAKVALNPNGGLSHALGLAPHTTQTRSFFTQMFAGAAFTDNCGKKF